MAADAAIVSFCFYQNAYYHGDGFGNLPIGAPKWMHSLKEAMGWLVCFATIVIPVLVLVSVAFSAVYWRSFKRLIPLALLAALSAIIIWFFGAYIFW